MLRNIIIIFIIYLFLSSLIYLIFLYDGSTVKSLKDMTFYSLDTEELKDTSHEVNEIALSALKFSFHKRKLGIPKVNYTTLNQGIEETIKNKNSAIISLIRNTYNEHLFKWAGPIFASNRHIYVLGKNYKKLHNHIEDISFVVISGFSDEQLLMSNFIDRDRIEVVDTITRALELITSEQKNAIVLGEGAYKILSKSKAYNFLDFKSIYNLGVGYYYFAFNSNTPNSIIQQFQRDINTFKNTSEYKNYVKEHNNR